jgi:hypothetical protein
MDLRKTVRDALKRQLPYVNFISMGTSLPNLTIFIHSLEGKFGLGHATFYFESIL